VTGLPSPARPLPRLRALAAVALGVLLLLLPVASARADVFVDVYKDFQKDGVVDACKFTAAELKEARDKITPDIEQYAPDFPAAVTLALESRTNGNCKKKAAAEGGTKESAAPAAPSSGGGGDTGGAAPSSSGSSGGTPEAVATPDPAATAQAKTPQPNPAPAPAVAAADGAIKQAALSEPTSGRSDDLPAAVVGLGALAGFLAVLALAWLIARALAWEPRFWPRARHACQEAGWRMSGTWADFTDWVRLGR